MKPMEIEQASMAIIERELQVALDPEIKPIVKRVIHATADFSFAESMVFTPGVVPYARALLARGATIVTDTADGAFRHQQTGAQEAGLSGGLLHGG